MQIKLFTQRPTYSFVIWNLKVSSILLFLLGHYELQCMNKSREQELEKEIKQPIYQKLENLRPWAKTRLWEKKDKKINKQPFIAGAKNIYIPAGTIVWEMPTWYPRKIPYSFYASISRSTDDYLFFEIYDDQYNKRFKIFADDILNIENETDLRTKPLTYKDYPLRQSIRTTKANGELTHLPSLFVGKGTYAYFPQYVDSTTADSLTFHYQYGAFLKAYVPWQWGLAVAYSLGTVRDIDNGEDWNISSLAVGPQLRIPTWNWYDTRFWINIGVLKYVDYSLINVDTSRKIAFDGHYFLIGLDTQLYEESRWVWRVQFQRHYLSPKQSVIDETTFDPSNNVNDQLTVGVSYKFVSLLWED